ncbi:MAG: class B sortase [Lachnospiraceae bacterium]|nr:class B sortase [Lachnospiraceae bacterium]
MAGTRYRVGDHNFYNETDYLNAKKDEALIAELRKKTDFRNRKQVHELYSAMQSGKISFVSVLGREFDDEVYETYQALKQQSDEEPQGKKKGKRTKKSQERERISHASEADLEREAQKFLKRRERQRRLFIVACAVVAAVCIGYFGYYQFMASRTQSSYEALAELREKDPATLPEIQVTVRDEAGEEEIILTVLDEYKTLYNKNRSLIGWLKIDDTNIDYPVMQSPDPNYYLTHNFNQEHDNNGSIFLDPDCDIVHRNTNLILYGHHMRSGKMFGSLDSYSSEAFYEEHKYITFDTIYEKGTYEVMYVFRSRIYNEDEIVFKYYQFIDVDSEQEFYSNMNEMAEMSLYDTGVTAVYGDKLLTLSTCDYREENGRFVVVAKRID